MSNCDRLDAKFAVGGTQEVIPPITLPPPTPPVADSLVSFLLDDAVVTGVEDGRLALKGFSGVGATIVCGFVLGSDEMVADNVVFEVADGAFTSFATVNSCKQL